MIRPAFLFLVVTAFSAGRAQDSLVVNEGFPQSEGWTVKKVVASGIVGGMLAGSLVSSYYDWWSTGRQPFHFVHEGFINDYSLGIDKLGHAYTSYFYFNAFRNIMLWGGHTPDAAFWWGAGASAFFALSVEIGDAVSPYGFSWEDLSSNMVGLGYGMMQSQVPFLRNVNFKWSYFPTDGWHWPPRFTDHYDGHTYWLTFNVHNLLPETWEGFWPEFLQVAIGYGVDDHQTRREFLVGLDIDLEAFRVDNEEVLLAQRIVNKIHLPAPAVKWTQGKETKWYLLQLN